MFLMVLGYNRGLIVFGLITATKPMTKPATEGAAGRRKKNRLLLLA